MSVGKQKRATWCTCGVFQNSPGEGAGCGQGVCSSSCCGFGIAEANHCIYNNQALLCQLESNREQHGVFVANVRESLVRLLAVARGCARRAVVGLELQRQTTVFTTTRHCCVSWKAIGSSMVYLWQMSGKAWSGYWLWPGGVLVELLWVWNCRGKPLFLQQPGIVVSDGKQKRAAWCTRGVF
jgi:hypothetical protein